MPDRRDPDHPEIAPPQTDDTVPQQGNRDGREGHYSGQEAGSFDSPSPNKVDAGSQVGGVASAAGKGAGAGQDATDLPPEAGHRAHVDQRTGEVHGAGVGAGGCQAGENYDSDQGGSEAN